MRYSFFLNEEPARAVALDHVRQDAQAARLSGAFRVYYRMVRPLLPLWIRQRLQSARRRVGSPQWYVPQEFMRDLVRGLASSETDGGIPVVHPWPGGRRFAFVLTHDVETAEGMRHVRRVAEIEQELGFRSSFNLVPHKYPIDTGLIRDLQDAGFEIGIHGYNHDGKLYLSRRTFQRRVTAINETLRRYGAVGFRSPMVHRNLDWLQALDIEYDASCFDVDPYQAMPGGVGSIWPFIAGRFVELPYTLPQDHTLFVVLGESTGAIWKEKLDFLAENHGMALMLTHPDYLRHGPSLAVYRDFLAWVKDRGGFWHALPREVARWWRRRDASKLTLSPDRGYAIHGPAADQGVPVVVRTDAGRLAITSPRP